jgi:2-keto-4-pentenoate hydratase/2-oxohepta-3-ene-1,7-dioic acid hydratase in catechol pathway
LVIRINKNGKYIQEKFAHKYYAEATLGLDLTARDIQNKLKKNGLPWELAKGFDGSAVLGTYLPITPETRIQEVNFRLDLNGEPVQHGFTGDMLFSIDKIIAFASNYFTLNIGDLIITGTPAGVGPLNIQDQLIGYLEGEKVFDVMVR